MQYRPEIDGLRAVAVLPVILFHAGWGIFKGGFVGVDVFFVISGYLITSIIFSELRSNTFSVAGFYERRARRILPALFAVMLASSGAGYFLLMPDEYKNLGQSLFATSVFSNNVLLALTSGYWDLASEFKPLLHTWSLGVEEQYYIVIPLLLLLCWRTGVKRVEPIFWVVFIASLTFAAWFVTFSPNVAFYLLPTRAWELALGALAAVHPRSPGFLRGRPALESGLALSGLILIVFSIFAFDKTIPSPGFHLLIPTCGAVLILVFCRHGSFVHRLLSANALVLTGLLSYSLYLWHQPVFAFFRAYSKQVPSPVAFLVLLPVIVGLSFLTWRYVERPFRERPRVGSCSLWIFCTLGTLAFAAFGLYLNHSYGMAFRVFDPQVRIQDMDKRIYNERAFAFKKDSFDPDARTRLLIVGNSFARDFVNILLENYDVSRVNLVYRDDLPTCTADDSGIASHQLYALADVIVFGSGKISSCTDRNIAFASRHHKKLFYLGTKDFGYNLNWLIHKPSAERANLRNPVPEKALLGEKEMSRRIPDPHFISLMAPTVVDGMIPITDANGRMLSTDRAHLTKYGAIYFGEKAVVPTAFSDIFQ